MEKPKENHFKSLENSRNTGGSNWSIISMKLTRTPVQFHVKAKTCLYREIVYIDVNHNVYQIGKLYVPLTNPRYVLFPILLFISRKTFGHYISTFYKNQYFINVIETSEPREGYNMFFNPASKIIYSKRIIKIIKNNKLIYIFYVEEELEVEIPVDQKS